MSSVKLTLRQFAIKAAAGYRGADGGDRFARELIGSFGPEDSTDAGAADGLEFAHELNVVDDGRRSKRKLSAYWRSRRAVLDVADRDTSLDVAWGGLMRACLQMEAAPQYVVLTNQRDVRLYDLARDRSEPRLSIALDELPKYSEAFPFFEPDWKPGTTPKIINVEKVSKDVADLVARVFRTLAKQNENDRDKVIRFLLQCIVAMFAEDIGLLPKEYFTTLLYRGAKDGNAQGLLAQLFEAMSSEEKNDDDIPFFNGGLFHDPVTVALDELTLRALTKAAEANWTFVDPHIFGSVFQGIMDDDERHAQGAHYTAREDIMSVVGPTIVEPWRERISAANTLKELKGILEDLGKFRVLDPACGSGNFLYVAFRELYRLETEALRRAHEFASALKGRNAVGWASNIRTTNFFGIDINPFAVELAKTTLNIAKKIAFEERKALAQDISGQAFLELDPSLPLDNLDENIVCQDALFAPWPKADALVGNPPFLGGLKIRSELGPKYVESLRVAFPDVNGRADLCSYWFRIAHRALAAGGRAGLIATNTIREGNTRAASTDFIVNNGGTITNAVSSRDWPGEAAVSVSMVNWVKGTAAGPFLLHSEDSAHRVPAIPPHLQLHADLGEAAALAANAKGTAQGIVLGTKLFQIKPHLAKKLFNDPASRPFIRPVAVANHLMRGRLSTAPDYVVDMRACESEAVAARGGAAFEHLQANVLPLVEKKTRTATTAHYKNWLRSWWRPFWSRDEFFAETKDLRRFIVCSRHAARPVFTFLSLDFFPTESLQLFAFDDDYSFGILQSNTHWTWAAAVGSKVEERTRYTSEVWDEFPWPQAPTEETVEAVAEAGRALRDVRQSLMASNGWSLRDLYQASEVAGPHPLKDAQARLDRVVEHAYGKPRDQSATEFLLELNLCLAEDESAGDRVQGPGLPAEMGASDSRWLSTDCIEPPSLSAEGDQDDG